MGKLYNRFDGAFDLWLISNQALALRGMGLSCLGLDLVDFVKLLRKGPTEAVISFSLLQNLAQ